MFRHSTSSIPDLAPAYRKAAVESYADALHVVFICHIAINILVFIACIPIEEHPLPYMIVTSDRVPILNCADISRRTLQEQEEHYRNQQLAQDDTALAVDSP